MGYTGRRTAMALAAAVLILYRCATSVASPDVIGPQDESVLVSIQAQQGAVHLSSASSPLEMMEDSQVELRNLSLRYNGIGFDESTRLEVSLRSTDGDGGKFRFATLMLGGIHFPSHELRGDAGDLTMIGTIASLNSALGALLFTPPKNFHGKLAIIAGLRCFNCEDHDTCVHQSTSVNIANVDDPLHVLWDGKEFIDHQIVLETDEDFILSLGNDGGTGLSLLDVDSNDTSIDVNISSEHGQICHVQQNKTTAHQVRELDLTFDRIDEYFHCEDGAKGLAVSGKLLEINVVLGTLVYVPLRNWWGFDTVTIDAVGNDETSSRKLVVRVNAMNDSPVLHLNGTYEGHVTAPRNLTLTMVEDSTLEITAISIQDNDCNDRFISRCILEVHVKVQHGTLSVEKFFSTSAFQKEGGKSIILRGTDSDLNQALRTLSYTPSKNFHGIDRLQATVLDFGLDSSGEEQLSFTRHIDITVSSVPDDPVITLPLGMGAFLVIQEDVDGVIGGDCDTQEMEGSSPIMSCESIGLHDVDEQGVFNVTIQCIHGMLYLPHLKDHGVEYSLANVNGSFARMTRLRAGADEITSVLFRGVIYRSDLNYNGMDEITISVNGVDGRSSSSIILVKVEAENDAPVLIVDGEHRHDSQRTRDGLTLERTQCDPLIVLEDEPSKISSMKVRDVDMTPQNAFVEISVAAAKGSVKVDEEATIQKWILASESDWESRYDYQTRIRFQCNLENTNAALKQLWYRSPKNFAGGDTLTVSVSDLGSTGSTSEEDFSLKDTAMIPVIIIDQQDNPSMSVPTLIEVEEDMPTTIVPPVAVFHPDSTHEEIEVSMMCTRGYLRLTSVNGLILTHGDTGYGSHIAGFGTVASWNSALTNMSYTTEQDRNTLGMDMDAVHFSVSNANTSSVNATIKSYMLVDALPVNDSPEWIVPGRNLVLQKSGGYTVESVDTLLVDEDQELVLTSVRISDVDLNDRDEPTFVIVKLKAVSGTIKLARTDGLYFFEGKDDSGFMHWKAAFDHSNDALSTMTYRGLPNFHGEDVLEFYVSDEGNIGAGGSLSSTIGIPITVAPVQYSPRVITPGLPIVCGEEEWCSIPSTAIDDPDNDDSLVRMEISVEKGRLSFGRNEYPTTIHFLQGTFAGDNFFRISGPLHAINLILRELSYLGTLGTSDDIDTIHIHVWTGDSVDQDDDILPEYLTAVDQIHVLIINSLNNRPSIFYEGAVYRADDGCAVEDQPTPTSHFVRDNVICKRLVDIAPISCLEDTECLVGESGSLPKRHGTIPQRQIVVQGSIESLNGALEGLVYLADDDVFGSDELHVDVKDVNSGLVLHRVMKDEIDIMIQIASLDDPPRLTGPSDVLQMYEDGFLAITGLQLHDADLSATGIDGSTLHSSREVDDKGLIELHIDVLHGSIRLNSVADLNFTIPRPSSETWHGLSPDSISAKEDADSSAANTQHWWSSVAFRGRLSDINNSLEQLTFLPFPNWNSEANDYAEVQIKVRKSPFSQDVDTFKVFIRVIAENDAPVVTFDSENLSTDATGKERLLVVEDSDAFVFAMAVDVDDDVLEVEIVVHNGYVSLSNRTVACFECGDLDDVTYITGSGQMADAVVFAGPVDAVNAKLKRIVFSPVRNYSGQATLTITARDAHGVEGVADLSITVTSVDDAAQLWVPVEASGSKPLIVLDEGDRLRIGSGWHPTNFVLRNSASTQDHRDVLNLGERAFYISDDDLAKNEETYHVELSVRKGSIRLDCTPPDCDGILFHDDISAGASVRFSGTLEGINDAAQHIIFAADTGENGSSELKIKLSDRKCGVWDDPNSMATKATGDARCDERFDFPTEGTLDIHVVAVNSAPFIRWLGKAIAEVTLDTKNRIGFAVGDEDMRENVLVDFHTRSAEGVMSVVLSVTEGILTLRSRDGLSFAQGSGVDDSTMQFHGALPDCNFALGELYYSCLSHDGCTEGVVELTLLVDDNGFSGKGGPKQDRIVIAIQVSV